MGFTILALSCSLHKVDGVFVMSELILVGQKEAF